MHRGNGTCMHIIPIQSFTTRHMLWTLALEPACTIAIQLVFLLLRDLQVTVFLGRVEAQLLQEHVPVLREVVEEVVRPVEAMEEAAVVVVVVAAAAAVVVAAAVVAVVVVNIYLIHDLLILKAKFKLHCFLALN